MEAFKRDAEGMTKWIEISESRNKRKARFLIHPHSRFMKSWDTVTTLALVFTAAVTPFEVSACPISAFHPMSPTDRAGVCCCRLACRRSHGYRMGPSMPKRMNVFLSLLSCARRAITQVSFIATSQTLSQQYNTLFYIVNRIIDLIFLVDFSTRFVLMVHPT